LCNVYNVLYGWCQQLVEVRAAWLVGLVWDAGLVALIWLVGWWYWSGCWAGGAKLVVLEVKGYFVS